MARPESSQPRRGRGRRVWVTVDDDGRTPAADEPDTERYVPRRRYPWHDDPDYDPAAHRRTPPPRPWTPPPPQDEPAPPAEEHTEPPTRRMPRKLTVTRVAALRSRELTQGGLRAFHRATTADGADRSGLTALTYATMMTYAVDAAVAVALANTLFFAAATAESKTNVALYLIITVAPFAVVAPVIGPMLDKLQRGRRAALAVSFAGRAVLAVVMAFNYDTWLLYPAALGAMVLSKSFAVLKAAVTPRVLPSAITLVTTNSRLTTFGLIAGGVAGAAAAGVAALWDSPGALIFTALLGVVGTVLCLRIPRWVESTIGEVAATLRTTARGRRTPMGRHVTVALWGNGAVRVLTGFLTLFVAFVVREQSETDPARQLFLIGIVGAAAGIGSFTGNAAGARRQFLKSDAVIMSCVTAAVVVSAVAALLPGIATAAVVGLIGAAASALAKVCLDAVIQRDLPEESRASAFGRSETVLALAWVFGGALGVLLPHDTFWLGFTVIAGVIALAGVQSALVARGRSLLPFIGHRARTGA
ncbi:MFS transporter [Pseudonocardia adelaidensis]|uniref:MFS family arabinose efflux permease n=1 Tax=Pseudonocardia adelaidensis TaxID=648754 RepID=A0ABP9NJV4_9PSEU